MGLDTHGAKFLTYLTQDKPLGETLTLGRQGNHTNWINPKTHRQDKYCEPMLQKEFGAITVHSLDASDYQKPTFIQDLNRSWEAEGLAEKKYSSILDFGTLEHVFNVPQALESIANACEVGGRIIHVQCHSDFCGHGFWQFSAELFFSWYTEANGFDDVEVFIAPLNQKNFWLRCINPSGGKRCDLSGKKIPKSYILVTATKTRDVEHRSCQQSDYIHKWDKHKQGEAPHIKKRPQKAQTKTRNRSFEKIRKKLDKLLTKTARKKLSKKLDQISPFPWWRTPEFIVKVKINNLIKTNIP